MKRLRLTTVLLAVCCCACAKREQIVIYSTARAQGRTVASVSQDLSDKPLGGFAVFKRVYDSEQLPKIAVDLGNWYDDSPAGKLTKGVSSAEAMNGVPYNLAAAGINDIRKLQADDFRQLVKSARFPVIASNLYMGR